jgi:uncharacterized protein Yka (UPF0111/DUF47 family)
MQEMKGELKAIKSEIKRLETEIDSLDVHNSLKFWSDRRRENYGKKIKTID